MTKQNRSNQKFSDEFVIRRNNIGLSLEAIAKEVGCHPTTIAQRLSRMGLAPADTRRGFMEDIYRNLTLDQQEWLADQLGPCHTIKEFLGSLLIEKFVSSNQASTKAKAA